MKKYLKYLIAAAVLAIPLTAYARLATYSSSSSNNLTRACFPKIGDVAITMAATTSTDADSGELDARSLYMLRCDTDAWVRFGAAAVTAVADDWLVGAGQIFFIPTGGPDNLRHISALSKDVDGDCRLIECQ